MVPSPTLTPSAQGHAYARAALLGNPSDGFGGRTLAVAIPAMAARVTLDAGSGTALIDAAIARFNRTAGTSVPAGGTLRTTIPREVGLGGSSAIVIATLRALCAQTGFELGADELATMALAVETDDLGIAAGPQDRFVQAHEGLLYMDFAAGARCEPLDPALLPPLFVAYARDGAAPSAGVHGDLRQRFDSGEERARSLLARIAALAERGRDALFAGRGVELGELMRRNFELRAELLELDPRHMRMIEVARELGAAANYAGSGGSIVGVLPEGLDPASLSRAFAAAGCECFRPGFPAG